MAKPKQSAPVIHPNVLAVALADQTFGSGKFAIRTGQIVRLEFTPSMVVAHDPTRPSAANDPLGPTLYSFLPDPQGLFSFPKGQQFPLSYMRSSGRMTYRMGFALLEVAQQDNLRVCQFCGQGFLKAVSTETISGHLVHHTKEAKEKWRLRH